MCDGIGHAARRHGAPGFGPADRGAEAVLSERARHGRAHDVSRVHPAVLVVVEAALLARLDLFVAGGAVHRDRLREVPVGLELHGRRPTSSSRILEGAEHPATEARPPDRGVDPHALELRRVVAVELDPAAGHRPPVEPGEQEGPSGRAQLVEGEREGGIDVEAVVEPFVEHLVVRPQARLGIGRAGIDRLEHDVPLHPPDATHATDGTNPGQGQVKSEERISTVAVLPLPASLMAICIT